ncbi:hypothetical protein PCASD_07073 [Puccinia coronata f. sp. avenae]|uniref:FCP1 homology domain-containing protein n=1 Tax=Puccinia coronata f. sp. avenae TaxID=200324 RepID=A0A2N5V6T3_9BASI|nr:hypothetical protein PCASD_07073 [Puccinia coronata f. sp. avenae]
MNSLTWLLAPRRPRSRSQSLSQPPEHSSHPANQPASNTRPATLSHSSSATHHHHHHHHLQLGTGPRETEAELVDKMVHSIERESGSMAANKLERKTSMGLDGALRFGLPGIKERRRTLHLEPGLVTFSPPIHNIDPADLINQSSSSSPTPVSSSSTTPPPPSAKSPSPSPSIKLFSSSYYNPYQHLSRLVPLRLGLKLLVLIRKFLSLFGLRLSSPDSTSTSTPAKSSDDYNNKPLFSRLLRFMWAKLTISKNSPALHKVNQQQQQQQQQLLPRRNKTLVLDLDETLIHSTSRLGGIGGGKSWSTQANSSAGLKVRVVEVVLDGRIVVYHVYKRPWVDFFLKTVSSWYTVVIFTASMREYADPVIDWLDQGRGLIEGRLFRESCTNIKGSYVKDLTVVERDLSKVCLVDNCPISYGLHQANGIPIEGWLNDPLDEGLLELLPILDSLRFTKDVRRILGLKAFSMEPEPL